MNTSQQNSNIFQNLSTLLAALLPVLQISISFIPRQSLGVLLFKDQVLLVTLIALIFSYMLIVAFKNTLLFEFTFQRKQHKNYKKFKQKTDPFLFSPAEIMNTSRSGWVEKPYYFTPNNIYYLLLPALIVMYIVFLGIGFFGNSHDTVLAFIQAVTYVFLIALTSLTLGVFYINELNRSKAERIEQEKWERVKRLVFESNSIPELPVMEFVAQLPQPAGANIETIIRVNNSRYYIVMANSEATKIQEISPYDINRKERTDW